jgi:hypothetical protein
MELKKILTIGIPLIASLGVILISCQKKTNNKLIVKSNQTKVEFIIQGADSHGELGKAGSSMELFIENGKVVDRNGNSWDSLGKAIDANMPFLLKALGTSRKILNDN